jgi:hypothetical protein
MTAAHGLQLTIIFMNFQVFAIQSCSQSMNKVVESLHQKFPPVSKSQLRNKVREMSDFVDNRWQVGGLLKYCIILILQMRIYLLRTLMTFL